MEFLQIIGKASREEVKNLKKKGPFFSGFISKCQIATQGTDQKMQAAFVRQEVKLGNKMLLISGTGPFRPRLEDSFAVITVLSIELRYKSQTV